MTTAEALLAPTFTLNDGTTGLDIIQMAFQRQQVEGSEPFLIREHFDHPIAPLQLLPPNATVHRAVETAWNAACLAITPIGSIWIRAWSDSGEVWVSAPTYDDAVSLMSEVMARVPERSSERLETTTLRTWHYGQLGPEDEHREIDPPGWGDIQANYPSAVAFQFSRLVEMIQPTGGGRLILLHGPPGTGKSTAIKTLAKEWSKWCTTHVVTDPERLFGAPSYLRHVVNSSDDPYVRPTLARLPEVENRWKLIVAEDADDYLRAGGRSDATDSLGRLLNVTDGINSDQHRVMVLVTTNEHIDQLHPALTRPGRCLAAIEFAKFAPDEARNWLPKGAPAPKGPATLAELLQASGEIEQVTDKEPERTIGMYL